MSHIKFYKFLLGITLALSFLQGCSTDEDLQDGEYFSCTASGTASGSVSTPNTSVQITNLSVNILNGTGSSYSISLPSGGTVTTSSTSYVHPTPVTVTTGASGGVTSQIGVQDTDTDEIAYCTLSIPGTGTGGTSGVVSITASPSTTAAKNSYVTVTATAPTITSPIFAFTQSSTSPTSVTVSGSSNGVVTFTSSVAQTVVLTATMTSNSSGAASASAQISIVFSENGNTGGAAVTMVSSTASPYVGSYATITATATGITDPVYAFSIGSNSIGGTGYMNGNQAGVTATSPGAVTLYVRAYSNSNNAIQATSQITLNFVAAPALNCTISHTYNTPNNVRFSIATNTGEQLRITALSPGEPWGNPPPTFPIAMPYGYFDVGYAFTGPKTLQVRLESVNRPGTFCNGGAYLTDSVYIY